jgi:hypothetical protein
VNATQQARASIRGALYARLWSAVGQMFVRDTHHTSFALGLIDVQQASACWGGEGQRWCIAEENVLQ